MSSSVMPEPVVSVQNVAKRYRLAPFRGVYRSFRETLAERLGAPLRQLAALDRRGALLPEAPAPARGTDFWALRDVCFDVQRGEVLGIIGRNGAGKSTVLKIVSRVTAPTEGSITLRGRVGSLLEVGTGFHLELTGRENIFLNGAILGMTRAEIRRAFDEIVDFAEVEQFLDTPVKRYSSGMNVRLAFAIAAHLQPEILLIDEVLAVGDLAFQHKCLDKMRTVSQQGRTILFVSHNMAAIAGLCSRVIVIEKGLVIADAPTRQAIEQFVASCEGERRGDLQERTDRIGDARVRFTDSWLEDAAGNQVALATSGQPLTVAARFDCAVDRPPADLVFAFELCTFSGQPLTELSNFYTGDVFKRFSPGQGEVRCRLARLPLQNGLYNYNLTVRSKGSLHDSILNAGEVRVQAGDFFGTGIAFTDNRGLLLLEHRWDVRPSPETASAQSLDTSR